ncbi:type 1 glutamine amidotransferase domain-containing protein [Coxiella burnetii]|uniref:Protease I n=1 Tax=Coxiella burnetii (strain Dugway 5J108-111) TaxID=434922 RepID=A9KDZ3_COXBN|nr:type 1 glutamine amidotransferase domain-containing protein [Coxiella burnetii]ABS77727.1 protease I [Coxiella burnetii Dugway 5J108-111]ACJ19911.1 protease I [Coxiella burnetii CbuK_Q154]AIT62931.1 Intracellular protease, PfpI family [Coxiella burnetii str. Namibia]ATN85365.1 glutamine amidotransferase [Coxiella burnetii str. Schperling]EAX32577.1 protease [Coxiella burnetii 'MSU Goat Q177']
MSIKNKKIIIYAENEYQELELWYPLLRMKEEGAEVTIVGPKKNQVYKSKLGYPVTAEATPDSVSPDKIDALIIPGGYAPDKMRAHKAMTDLVRSVFERQKTVAAICHAAWVLISANIINGKKATCYHTVKDDLINAGGIYLDQPVVKDENLITSRQPDDLPQFCQTIIASLQ